MTDINPNEIASSVASDLIKSTIASIRNASTNYLSDKYDKLFEDFSEYLEVTLNKCSLVRTIITKEKPYKLEDIYVNTLFKCANKLVDDNALIQEIRDNERLLITGFGGIGKTVFAKYAWLSIYKEPGGRIPIFIELRRLNTITSIDIESFVRNALLPNRRRSRDEFFQYMMEEGRFIFIFDALDEVKDEKREEVERQILQLSAQYLNCGVVVTSRFDRKLESWEAFTIYKAEPFSKEQVKLLFSKIEFDEEVKKKFVKQVIEKQFREHHSFLSTPLLALMMLMTFSQFGELPEKVHIFYRYAFQTLYAWHDASKEAFTRERKTGLVIDQFEKTFAIFCLLSYYSYATSFDELELKAYIEKVKSQLDFPVDTTLFIEEAEQSVNLIFREGLLYSFTHRSFQEYFSAYALSSYFPNRIVEILHNMPIRRGDNMLSMFYDLNPVIAEENVLIPEYEKFRLQIEAVVRERNPKAALASLDFRVYAHYFDARKHPGRGSQLAAIDFISGSGSDENAVIRLSEIVTAMFNLRYDKEVEQANTEDSGKWIAEIEQKANEFASLEQGFDKFRWRIIINYRRNKIECWRTATDREPFELHREVDLPDDMETTSYYGSYVRRQLVFTKKIYEETRRRQGKKRVSIEDLLNL